VNALCICEHEPHEGECPEGVRTVSGTMDCGCEEYCPKPTTGDPCESCGWPDDIHDAACERSEVPARDAVISDGLTLAERSERDFGYE
jgi:hypothetical protein